MKNDIKPVQYVVMVIILAGTAMLAYYLLGMYNALPESLELASTDFEYNPIYLFAFLIDVVLGILIGMDAKKRGMDGFSWMMFTILLLIVDIPIYLIVRKPLLPDAK